MSMILTLNAGSSSIKFSVYGDGLREAARGQVENLGPDAHLSVKSAAGRTKRDIGAADHRVAVKAILAAIDPVLKGRAVAGIGHRIVHGGIHYDRPRLLDEETLDSLAALAPLAPLHQPHNLAAVDAARQAFPDAPQIACFDTAFHRGHPFVNDAFALPRRFYDEGVRRYGFHGLSYDYITRRLASTHPDIAGGRVVIAHLGNGASMCATLAGRSMGSTMGFSALDGLPMGTRSGQLDPGVLLYLMREKAMSAPEIERLLYHESGLKGLSGISHDMRTLLASDAPEAAQAIDYYVFRIRRELGAMAAVLEGLDGVVFCGGVGENAAPIRARVMDGMGWLGLEVDAMANAENSERIDNGACPILVIPTNEEWVIANAVEAYLEGRTA